MTFPEKDILLTQAENNISAWHDELASLPDLALSSFNPQTTALFVVDMVVGFAVSGALSSPRIGELISPIAALVERCHSMGMPIVAFADTHTSHSIELSSSYPPHCLQGTVESQVCPEIIQALGQDDYDFFTLIEKNSTNGFVESAFEQWLRANPSIKTYLVVGDCTDICISQFALTAKAWHNTRDIPLHVIVPVSLNDTFDASGHSADVMNVFSLVSMRANGIELCRNLL